ncbi:ribosomal RNA small subunit methyltransferase A [Pseudonocardia humida]|uniref:rRNA adenine N(6)-methyltransferase family protein n=1 Tax=Pseudonocardia humida TaxID=2800819 RepID=A0ABT0ZVW4_9PSEU|nr:rRNA adenine N(6)-methyltransferase family protein [Pseudonocardia humida]MCO1654882.1 rRNA adenine N(6)-methyltransferase family protein [Pseudonocardia humida]
MPSSFRGHRHELGQNHLIDRGVAARIAGLVPPGAVLELGAGDGALTRLLAARPWPVTAVELDPARVEALRRGLGRGVRVVHADMLRFPLAGDHHVVSNVPFGITTAVLRRLLAQRSWMTAVLLLQWEVARKRAAVGGTTLLTASWWPWFEFDLAGRVPAAAFRPRPAVDGGLLVVRRRAVPLVDPGQRAAYQHLVRTAFAGDRLLPALRRVPGADRWAAVERVPRSVRPRDLRAEAWASLHRAVSGARRLPERRG